MQSNRPRVSLEWKRSVDLFRLVKCSLLKHLETGIRPAILTLQPLTEIAEQMSVQRGVWMGLVKGDRFVLGIGRVKSHRRAYQVKKRLCYLSFLSGSEN